MEGKKDSNKKVINQDRRDSKTVSDKGENKNDKIERPLKSGKNRHSFVVSGIIYYYNKYFFRNNI